MLFWLQKNSKIPQEFDLFKGFGTCKNFLQIGKRQVIKARRFEKVNELGKDENQLNATKRLYNKKEILSRKSSEFPNNYFAE